MLDLTPFVRPGTGIWWSQGSAEPTPLVHALLDQADRLGPVHAFCGLSWDERLTTALPESVHLMSYGALGNLRMLSRAGRLEVVPTNYSSLPRLFAQQQLPSDVGFVQVSPPDADGRCTLGIGVDYIADALEHTPTLIAEINQRMPATQGAPTVPLARFRAVIETDRPLVEAPAREPDDVDRVIAGHVASLIDDGCTIQIGVGPLPSAVLGALHGHTDLGMHSGIVTDPALALVQRGVITGARKEIDRGLIVGGSALGSARLFDAVPDLPVRFCPASYTHAGAVLAQLRSLVAVNSAIEVDLSGQVGAEVRRGAYIGAIGGQADFCRAASSTGARSIIALRSTSGIESTVVAQLAGATVTTPRADVDHVVTEHGVATLSGATIAERARRLTAIAAPEHRESVERAIYDIARNPPEHRRSA